MSCSHLDAFWAIGTNIRRFKMIYAHFVKPSTQKSCVIKALHCICSVCKKHTPRLHACLYCITFGCYSPGHIHNHARNEKHLLAIDINQGHVFCFECGDYVYSNAMYSITDTLKDAWHNSLPDDLLYRPWSPDASELELLEAHKDRIKSKATLGLRGLYNLGSTCFMNCTVQALMHTPFLRSFFFSDMHTCSLADNCLICEMHNLFQQFFSGQEIPLKLHKMLHIVWNQARHMAGYEQQDAHEFFIATLDLMHQHCVAQPGQFHAIQPFKCQCIIDRVFTGGLRSDIVCKDCKNVSTTIDPFWDISLDIGTDPHSLIDCLNRFTRTEHLDDIMCSNCNSCQDSHLHKTIDIKKTNPTIPKSQFIKKWSWSLSPPSTKQLTMKELPLIACFHLKRFEHSSKSSHTYIRKKIYTQIDFPAELDMTPFLSHARNGSQDSMSKNNIYSLYAVTNHVGSIDSGHYTAFIKHCSNWYKCDDHLITPVSLDDVLASEGYQLFYHKKDIKYEADDNM